jgi:hypothetical protein
MGRGTPPAVKDTSKTTKVNDWSIPITVDGAPGKIFGTLWWTPQDDSGPPIGAIVGLIALALVGGAFVLVVRSRRRGAASAAEEGAQPSREAW